MTEQETIEKSLTGTKNTSNKRTKKEDKVAVVKKPRLTLDAKTKTTRMHIRQLYNYLKNKCEVLEQIYEGSDNKIKQDCINLKNLLDSEIKNF